MQCEAKYLIFIFFKIFIKSRYKRSQLSLMVEEDAK